MSINYGYQPISVNGLVLHLDAANPNSYRSGSTTWNDLSGNRNNGTLINGPGYSSANFGSITFDGIDDFYSVNHDPSLNCVDGVSVFIWTRASSATISKEMVMKYDSVTPAISYGLQFWSDSKVYYHVYTTSGWTEVPSSVNYIANTWYYLGLTYNKTNLVGYMNGSVSVSTSATGTIVANTKNLQCSQGGPATSNIATIKVYNRALSASEVQQNYLAQKSRYGL